MKFSRMQRQAPARLTAIESVQHLPPSSTTGGTGGWKRITWVCEGAAGAPGAGAPAGPKRHPANATNAATATMAAAAAPPAQRLSIACPTSQPRLLAAARRRRALLDRDALAARRQVGFGVERAEARHLALHHVPQVLRPVGILRKHRALEAQLGEIVDRK